VKCQHQYTKFGFPLMLAGDVKIYVKCSICGNCKGSKIGNLTEDSVGNNSVYEVCEVSSEQETSGDLG
jgi:hypothetical protein